MIRRCALLLATSLLAGCTNTPDLRLRHASEPEAIVAVPRERYDLLRLVTYNAGLAIGFLPGSVERAPEVVRALAEEPADVLCVQEFWLESHWKALTSAVGSRLPFALRPPAEEPAGRACSSSEVSRVSACMHQNCEQATPEHLAACAVEHCRPLAETLSGECLSCLSRDPMRAIDTILGECGGRNETASATASKYFYGGSYGIGLLTGETVLESDMLQVASTQHPRAILYAKLATDVAKPLHVFCTHLTPDMGNMSRTSGSWRDEQQAQLKAMLAFVEQKTRGREPAVIMGDLNTGPALGAGISARLNGHYGRILSAGFENPYATEPTRGCTYCYDNPITGQGRGGSVIDHILVRDVPGLKTTRRILDGRVNLRLDGRNVSMPLSDHFGLSMTIQQAH
jgi:endonuclease/exonuclease/phosphatase family metal-dependent hydrolase